MVLKLRASGGRRQANLRTAVASDKLSARSVVCTPKGSYGNTAHRAQRSEKFNLAQNFQPRSKFLIPLENFNLDVSISPTKNGATVGGSLENFILARNFRSKSLSFFDLWALWELSKKGSEKVLGRVLG